MAHGHTVLAQVLQLILRSPIEAWDTVHGTGRPSRVLSRRSPFGSLVFIQLAGRHSLRDVVGSLAAHANALAPLGMRPPSVQPSADANARRLAARYPELLTTRYTCCRTVAPTHRFRLQKPPLFPGSHHPLTVFESVPLGPFPHDQRRHEGTDSTGPCRPYPGLGGGHRGQTQRSRGGSWA
jgi:Domain of unknown function (DUF4372)